MAFLNYVRNQWDRVGAWACIGLGAISLLIGWLGVSSHAYPAEQNSYIASGGLFGLFLLGLGGLMWISADLRDEWRKLDAIERALAGQDAAAPPAPEALENGRARSETTELTGGRGRRASRSA